jgi:DNA-binding transcriptional LysR family regulator
LLAAALIGGFSWHLIFQIIARPTPFFQSILIMIYIRSMNLNSLDLNLLVALDALLREASVSRAAMRIGLSQPAVSHALQRLRDLIGDPLLVRNGARMELTPRAQALRAPLAQALDQVRALFIPDDFDAASSERQFRLMMPDLAVELLMPPLMERITQAAPNVRIDVVPWRGPAIFSAEFARTIDLVISIGNAFSGFHRQRLYTDSDALAVRHGHPASAKLKKREAFLNARHVAVIIRGRNEDLIDDWLRAKGIERRIALVVPGYIEALHVTARTDLVAFVPRRLIAALSKQLSLVTVTPPLDPGIDEQFMFYPTRAQMDPGSIWLRHIMLGIGREMEREKRKVA